MDNHSYVSNIIQNIQLEPVTPANPTQVVATNNPPAAWIRTVDYDEYSSSGDEWPFTDNDCSQECDDCDECDD